MLNRTLAIASVVALGLLAPDPAEAKIDRSHAQWAPSAQNCALGRKPPGRRWRALPPRICPQAGRHIVDGGHDRHVASHLN